MVIFITRLLHEYQNYIYCYLHTFFRQISGGGLAIHGFVNSSIQEQAQQIAMEKQTLNTMRRDSCKYKSSVSDNLNLNLYYFVTTYLMLFCTV